MKPITIFSGPYHSSDNLFGTDFLRRTRTLYIVSKVHRNHKILTKQWCKVWKEDPGGLPEFSIILINKISPFTILAPITRGNESTLDRV